MISPDFMKQLNTTLASESVDNWKNYLRFHISATSTRPYLSDEFFDGALRLLPEYLRGHGTASRAGSAGVEYVDRSLGEALGQAYVRAVFSPELKASTLKMVEEIRSDGVAYQPTRLDESHHRSSRH